ncbi:MAG: hypothetical protein R3B72_44590 [Polyangiaceae bacterium]
MAVPFDRYLMALAFRFTNAIMAIYPQVLNMGLIGGLWLVVLGVLGAANLIIARKPDAIRR